MDKYFKLVIFKDNPEKGQEVIVYYMYNNKLDTTVAIFDGVNFIEINDEYGNPIKNIFGWSFKPELSDIMRLDECYE